MLSGFLTWGEFLGRLSREEAARADSLHKQKQHPPDDLAVFGTDSFTDAEWEYIANGSKAVSYSDTLLKAGISKDVAKLRKKLGFDKKPEAAAVAPIKPKPIILSGKNLAILGAVIAVGIGLMLFAATRKD